MTNNSYFHRSSDQCRVMGYWPCCRPYPPCPWRWYPPLRSGSLRQHVPWWSYVRPHQDLAQMAPSRKCAAEALCHVLCHRCYWNPSSCHVQRYLHCEECFLGVIFLICSIANSVKKLSVVELIMNVDLTSNKVRGHFLHYLNILELPSKRCVSISMSNPYNVMPKMMPFSH